MARFKVNDFLNIHASGFLNSYSQIFFSQKKILSLIILFVTFFDTNAGLCGLIGVLSANLVAYTMGFNRFNISLGLYGFNALLVSLGLGINFNPGIELFIIIFFASLLTFFLTILCEGVIGKYRVPYLSIPFLISIWLVTLATRHFTALTISDRSIYIQNEIYTWGGLSIVNIYNYFNTLFNNEVIIVYFKSLGAIFFQYNLLAGILLALGLLIYSRQAFVLSLLGFVSAYYYYYFIGANINELNYTYIGFNFILTAIAIGGFFIVPSVYSYFFVVLLTPIISVLLTSTSSIFWVYQLSVLSLPFNIVVIIFLYVLKFREYRLHIPEVVVFPKSSPEENLYLQKNSQSRFKNFFYFPIELPLRGQWRVSQGQDGEITHKENWKHAWDFDIIDEENKTYKSIGTSTDDYYCFNKPIIAPADGVVEKIEDNIPDNEIGDVNVENNWGNTIIIKHSAFLFSKISHLKMGSFKVTVGEFVKKGTVLAYAGNSGRSPEPHVHFQLQSTPFIGSDTLDYPISHFVVYNDNSKSPVIKSYDKPQKNEIISNVSKEKLIYNALHFIPGQKINLDVTWNDDKKEIEWEVITDIYNNTYIYCSKTKSKAFIFNDGVSHYFTGFEGDKNSLLYYFYLGFYKVLMNFYKNLYISDVYPVNKMIKNIPLLFLQDLIAPFYMFIRCNYSSLHQKLEATLDLESVSYQNKTEIFVFGKRIKYINFEIEINEDKQIVFNVNDKKNKITAVCKG